MKEFTYTIKDEFGIHARPAGLLVKAAAGYNCNVALECNGKVADAKKIFSVMSLGAKQGNVITVRTEGIDEIDANLGLEDFFKNNL